jgi:hypothetical protein
VDIPTETERFHYPWCGCGTIPFRGSIDTNAHNYRIRRDRRRKGPAHAHHLRAFPSHTAPASVLVKTPRASFAADAEMAEELCPGPSAAKIPSVCRRNRGQGQRGAGGLSRARFARARLGHGTAPAGRAESESVPRGTRCGPGRPRWPRTCGGVCGGGGLGGWRRLRAVSR